ncbi:MAG: phosphatidylserine decarboxylase family protein [Breznakibacter sp.]
MTIHKEGFGTIIVTLTALALINLLAGFVSGWSPLIMQIALVPSVVVFFVVLNFFRSPRRHAFIDNRAVVSPADGKVVVIEEVEETEYLKTRCIQVSVFMSPFNVHINWFPVKGIVRYFRHHNGRFMAAYLPKSSTENERTSVVVEHANGKQILVRQVAGAMARRIVCYANEGTSISQGDEMGFIKFGSRVDVYFPLGSEIEVKLGQKVTGRQTILGWIE